MSTRCNIAIKLKEKDLDKELTFDDIHFLKTKKEYPFMEVYSHRDGTPENAKRFFFQEAGLTDYESVLKYILEGDRTSFSTSNTDCGEQWSENRPYQYASLDGDIPEMYYYIFMDDKWYFKERISANDQHVEWQELVADDIATQVEKGPDFEYIVNEVQQLVEKLTDGKYTLEGLTKEMLKRKGSLRGVKE